MNRALCLSLLGTIAFGCLPPSGDSDARDTDARADGAAASVDGGAMDDDASPAPSDGGPEADAVPEADAAPPTPTCDDAEQNGDETDIDCGGACAACPPGQGCALDEDCDNVRCVEGQCAEPDCGDTLHNGDESDLDCGGACAGCAEGQACATADDCADGDCFEGVCFAPRCDDGRVNGAETDIDCGGGECAGCAPGLACEQRSDCADGDLCDEGVCAAALCDDLVRSGAETGLDCGGPECAPCPAGEGCAEDDDCVDGRCAGDQCAAPACDDGVRNGDESGVDCGGPCERCALAGLSCEEIDALWPAGWTAIEDAVLEATNAVRERGANCDTEGQFGPTRPLAPNARLRCAARRHSDDMGLRGFFGHVSPDGGTMQMRIDATGYVYRRIGENIYAGRESAQAAVDAWVESDGHCRNIMDPNFTQLGAGYAHAPNGRPSHFHTQNFGTPR